MGLEKLSIIVQNAQTWDGNRHLAVLVNILTSVLSMFTEATRLAEIRKVRWNFIW